MRPAWWVQALAKRRFQLLGAFVFAVILPSLFRWPTANAGINYAGVALSDTGIANGLIGSSIATGLGFVTLRQLRNHPGVSSSGYVFYAFALTYGVLAILLLFLRAEYSRYQLGLSFLVNLLWFLAIHRVLRRNTWLRFAVVPNEGMRAPPSTPSVRWQYLKSPQLDTGTIDGVVADLRFDHDPEWSRLLARCALAGLPVYDIRKVSEQLTGRVPINHLSENTFVSTLQGLIYLKVKRGVDILGVVLLAPGFAIAIGAAVLAIRLSDGGPGIFRQVRMGHRGRPFTIYKLRTMREDAASGEQFTSDCDPRITPIGGFLRKYRIDEFPQIWNILKGDMSWIGPRPESLDLADWYEREVPFYSYRHMVRPGITGWAQVNQGNVAKIDAATEKLHYDFYYIKHLSPWLELLIAAKTVQTILTGFGSR